MRPLAIGLLVSLTLAACGSVKTVVPLAAAPAARAAASPAAARAAPSTEAQLFRLDGGFTFPLKNGARLDIENGWIEPHFAQLAPGRSADLDVVVGGPAAAGADVLVSYEMVEMAHGLQTIHTDPTGGGHHLAHIPMGMYGTWRISIKVVGAGRSSVTDLLLSGTGL